MATATNDIAVVTGGASGIGLATVEVLAERGIQVIAVDRDEDKLAELQNRDRIHPLYGDVSANATWDQVVTRAKTNLGASPNMYVANAATVIVGTTLELSDDDWHTIFETNLMGSVRGARALLPGMIAAGKGAMVLIGSIDGFMAEQGLAAYCATKRRHLTV
jgi:NADP-dependent 3-hydroxy acid dehydrogenase YdfG